MKTNEFKSFYSSIGMKVCTQCNEPKLLEQFSKRKLMKDGLRSECKDCDNANRKARRERKQEVPNSIAPIYIWDNEELPVMEDKEPLWLTVLHGIIASVFVVAIAYILMDGWTK